MLSLLRTGRWRSFTAAAFVAIIAFGLLSLWQYHRAEEKRVEFDAVAARMASDPAVPDYRADSADVEWQHVTLRGVYDPQAQVLIRNRPLSGGNGFWVASLLRTEAGSSWVVRGWIPAQGNATAEAAPPAPPAGEVAVDGFARLPDPEPARRAADVPAGQATAMNPAELSALLGRPAPSAWYVISARNPQDAAVTPIPTPEPTDSRNLSYAGQWLLFAAITIGGWFFFLRREAAEQQAADRPVPVEAAP